MNTPVLRELEHCHENKGEKDFGSFTEGEVNKQSAMTESQSNEKA